MRIVFPLCFIYRREIKQSCCGRVSLGIPNTISEGTTLHFSSAMKPFFVRHQTTEAC